VTDPAPTAAPAEGWEPNAQLQLRWGGYRSRQLAGLALVCIGGLLILPANAATVDLAFLGSAIHVAGWLILPAPGWRRVVAAGPSLIALWSTILGARTLFILAVPLLLWLIVRRRRLPSYPVVALPVLANLAGLSWFGIFDRPPLVTLCVGAVVTGAWLAVLVSRLLKEPSKRVHSGDSPVEG